jgi:cytochrome P450
MLAAEALYSDDYARNPEPVWRQLRDEHPCFHDTVSNLWVLSRYDDVAAVFADHETYSAATYEHSTGAVLGPTLISRDDHGHVVRRSIVAPDFVGKRLATYRPMVERCANALIDGIDPAGGCDVVADLTARLPVDVIAAMLGMEGDGQLFREWVTAMIRGLAPSMHNSGREAHRAFCSHIAPALDGIDDPARHDLIAKIARADADGERLDHEELVAFCGLLFIAGGETTDKAMSSMLWHLMREPELLREVMADPTLWDNAFSETMRRTAPVVAEDRFTRSPVSWHGVDIPEGARVRVMLGAANLDPSRFAVPERFDLHRSDLHLGKELRYGASPDADRSGHFGFGLGKHFCIGYELARMESIVGSQLLIERCGVPRIAVGEEPAPVLSRSFRAVGALRVEFALGR